MALALWQVIRTRKRHECTQFPGRGGWANERRVVDTLFKLRSTESVSAATRVRQISTEEMHAITEQSDAWMHAVAKFSCAVHMPFGREPMTCRVVWEPSHGWSVVSDLIYFVDLRSASPQRRRRVWSASARHSRAKLLCLDCDAGRSFSKD